MTDATLERVTFLSGRSRDSYRRSELTVHQLVLPPIPPNLTLPVARRYRRVQLVLEEMIPHAQQILVPGSESGGVSTDPERLITPGPLDVLNDLAEEMVFQMRHTLDFLVQCASILTTAAEGHSPPRVRKEMVSEVLKSVTGGSLSAETELLFGDPASEKSVEFAQVIDGLHNAMKHSFLLDETFPYFSPDGCPIVTATSVRHNEWAKPVQIHNHDAFELVMGFQDSVQQVLGRLRTYSDERCLAEQKIAIPGYEHQL